MKGDTGPAALRPAATELATTTIPTMPIDELQERASELPDEPGVYLFKDGRGQTLYVGKAKSIRDRVRSHLAGRTRAPKQEAMLAEAADVDVIVTDSDLEALALENSLVKQNRPRYNVKLRDDKNYPYLRLTVGERFPRLQYVRGVDDDGEEYFGPYAPAATARRTQLLVYRQFGVRPCNIDIDGSWDRPCLYYDIGECAGPCVADLCSEEEYAEVVDQALAWLEGRGEDLASELRRRMKEASEAREYERAAHYRDLLETVRLTARDQKVATTGTDDRDLFGLWRDDDRASLQVFLVRRGLVVDRKQFTWDDVGGTSDPALLGTFLQQYYDGEQVVPPEICVSSGVDDRELLESWLKEVSGHAVRVKMPRRGPKKRLMDLVVQNARLALESRRSGVGDEAGAQALQEILDLDAPPRVIECIDISNFQSGEIVAALVRFRDGEPDKSGYKRFRIRDQEEADDYRAMAQAVRRHFRRVVGGERPAPDLLLVDGGRGQLNVAGRELDRLGMPAQPLGAVAKQEEKLYARSRTAPVLLRRHPAALRLVQRVRDESHRFAVTYHRKLRSRRRIGSVLEEVPGIGPTRRKALLSRFGSVEGVRRAADEELAAAIGPKLAARLRSHLEKLPSAR